MSFVADYKIELTPEQLAILNGEQGETMANASANSGFGNYSCFYKHYKKYYKQ